MIRSYFYTFFLSLSLLFSSLRGLPRNLTARTDLLPSREAVNFPGIDAAQSDVTADLPGVDSNWWAAAQQEINQGEYQITWQERTYLDDLPAAYQAPNRAHNLRTYFTTQGIRVIPRLYQDGPIPWEWGVSLSGYGYPGDMQPVSAASMVSDGNRIMYQRGDLAEWYINTASGLEQGFTLVTPPDPTAENLPPEITLDLSLNGNLVPHLIGNGGVEFTTSGGVRVLRYSELVATDAAGQVLPARLSLYSEGREGFRITLDTAGAKYPITVDAVVTSPSWTAESDQADAFFGHSVATAGDVNGDGYSDVIVGASAYDNGNPDEGRAYVFHGSSDGLSPTASWIAESNKEAARLGFRVATAGDVNGDGYSDVIIGAYTYENGEANEGRVFVWHGSPNGVNNGLAGDPDNAAWSAESDQAEAYFGTHVATAGDVNGDGYSDIIVGALYYDNGEFDEGSAFVWFGSDDGVNNGVGGTPGNADWRAEGDQVSAFFGYAVSTAGDVNGDGFSDVITSAYYYDNGQTDEGRAYVYYGSSGGLALSPNWTAEGDQDTAFFGYSVNTAGDVNGDGYSDVIVGAEWYDNGETNEGRAYVYHGASSGLSTSPAWSAEGNQADAWFGHNVATAGDVNGDGYADVIVGAHNYDHEQTDEGGAFVYHGSAAGLTLNAAWSAESDQDTAYFGVRVSTAGDVNGDGYSDVIVGAFRYDNGETDEGRAYVYHGGPASLSATANWMAESDQSSASFGYSVGTAGDVNGDGYSDVVVGAPYYDNGQSDEGRAYVYYGPAVGISTMPDWTAEGNLAIANFGAAVGTAGDVNGDGYSDVIVGAPSDTGIGWVAVYHGGTAGLNLSPAWTISSDQAAAFFGYAVGTAGDVNGDGYGDVIVGAYLYDNGQADEGRTYAYYGSAAGLNLTPGWTTESDQAGAQYGVSVGTAGDVNGDSYSDIIIGAPDYDNGQTDEGRTYVYYGDPNGLAAVAAWSVESDLADASLGAAVGTAGDVNGDGYSDVIVGAPSYSNGEASEGRAYAFYSSAAGISTTPDWTVEGNQAVAYLGCWVGTAGDVNGDGYSDVIVGAQGYDNDQVNEGRAYVYHGALIGLAATADWIGEGEQDEAWLGRSVGTAGDVNGDGYSEVIAGADRFDAGQLDEGRAFVYYGNGGNGLHLLPRQLRNDDATPVALLGNTEFRTTFQLSLIGRMPLGRGDVRLQWQVAPLGLPFTSAEVISGSSDWSDVLTTGVSITEEITGLAMGTPYHWRVRLLYEPGNPLGQPAGRWVTIPWNGWNELDLRTLPNQPPVADAGADQNVDKFVLVTLDGSGSSDPEGDLPLDYLWTQISGPAVVLSDPAAVRPTFTAPGNPAVLTFTLLVTDSLGTPAVMEDEVTITVEMIQVYLPFITRN